MRLNRWSDDRRPIIFCRRGLAQLLMPLGDKEFALPAQCARIALEWSGNMARYPAAIEISRLRLNLFTIDEAGIHEPRVKSEMAFQNFKSRGRSAITPGSRACLSISHDQVMVAGLTFPLAETFVSIWSEWVRGNILRREVVCRGMAGLQSTDALPCVRDDPSLEPDQEVAFRPLGNCWARIIPNALLTWPGCDRNGIETCHGLDCPFWVSMSASSCISIIQRTCFRQRSLLLEHGKGARKNLQETSQL